MSRLLQPTPSKAPPCPTARSTRPGSRTRRLRGRIRRTNRGRREDGEKAARRCRLYRASDGSLPPVCVPGLLEGLLLRCAANGAVVARYGLQGLLRCSGAWIAARAFDEFAPEAQKLVESVKWSGS